MGEQKVSFDQNQNDQQQFILALLDDIHAIEELINSEGIENSV